MLSLSVLTGLSYGRIRILADALYAVLAAVLADISLAYSKYDVICALETETELTGLVGIKLELGGGLLLEAGNGLILQCSGRS